MCGTCCQMGVSNDGDEGGGARGPHAVTPASAEESKAAKTSEPLAASMSEPPSPATLAGAWDEVATVPLQSKYAP